MQTLISLGSLPAGHPPSILLTATWGWGGMERRKPLIRAQFYSEEAKTLRKHAADEKQENRRKVLLELADNYDETAKMLIEQAKGIRRKP